MHIRDLSRKPAFTLLLLLTVLLSACGTNPPPAPAGIENIHVDTVRPTEERVETETFPLPNCGGTSELDQTLGTNASIQKSVTIGVKAGTEGGGEVSVSAAAKLQLKVAVEAAYQQTYESANSRLDTIGMKAAAGTHVTYEIGWYEQTFESVVDYSENNQVYQAPYTYKLRVPKIDDSYQTDCPGGGEDEPQPKPTNTQAPRPTATAAPVVKEPALEVGQTFTQDGQSLTLDNAVLTLESGNWSPAHLGVSFVFRNDLSTNVLFSISHENFLFRDNLGNMDNSSGWGWPCYTDNWQVDVPAGGTLQTIDCEHQGTNGVSDKLYDRLIWFEVDITDQKINEVIITVQNFSRINNARWRVEIPH